MQFQLHAILAIIRIQQDLERVQNAPLKNPVLTMDKLPLKLGFTVHLVIIALKEPVSPTNFLAQQALFLIVLIFLQLLNA
jgi:hypothetical protein